MTTPIYNLTRDNKLDCQQGADYILPIQWQDANETVVSIASTYTVICQIKDRHRGNILISLTTENSGIEIDSNENIVLLISADDTSEFEPGMYVYDIKLIPIGSGTTVRFLEGTFEVTPQVSE